jgi:hypothetical protein
VNPPADATRGPDALRRLLADQTLDLRGLDLAGFRGWLARLLVRWQADPVFAQRALVRDLRRAHPELDRLEAEAQRAAAADAASPQADRLRRLERELGNARKALAGLAAALEAADSDKRPALAARLEQFRARRQALEGEQAALTLASLSRGPLLRAGAELDRLRAAVGLDREEVRLAELLTRRGRGSGRAGESFEETALALTRREILPELPGDGPVRVLTGVTLGAARVEFDQLVVRPTGGGGPVEVLAAVEVKRNVNDLAHGFRRRQEDLAWLTGAAAGYDPALYRTRRFRRGHFDREAVHRQGGEAFPFTPGSFRHFRRDPDTGLVLGRLYFVTRPGPLWGVSGAALNRVAARVAADPRWAPDDAAYLGKLLAWCRSLAGAVESPDVLRLYAATPERARHVLLAG